MNKTYFYHIKAAELRARVQTEHDPVVRSAMEDLALDYVRLAEGLGPEPVLTVDFEIPLQTQVHVKH